MSNSYKEKCLEQEAAYSVLIKRNFEKVELNVFLWYLLAKQYDFKRKVSNRHQRIISCRAIKGSDINGAISSSIKKLIVCLEPGFPIGIAIAKGEVVEIISHKNIIYDEEFYDQENDLLEDFLHLTSEFAKIGSMDYLIEEYLNSIEVADRLTPEYFNYLESLGIRSFKHNNSWAFSISSYNPEEAKNRPDEYDCIDEGFYYISPFSDSSIIYIRMMNQLYKYQPIEDILGFKKKVIDIYLDLLYALNRYCYIT